MIPKKSLDSVLDKSIILTIAAPNDNAKLISLQCTQWSLTKLSVLSIYIVVLGISTVLFWNSKHMIRQNLQKNVTKKVRGILNRTFQTKRRFLNFNIVEHFLVKGQKNVVM